MRRRGLESESLAPSVLFTCISEIYDGSIVRFWILVRRREADYSYIYRFSNGDFRIGAEIWLEKGPLQI